MRPLFFLLIASLLAVGCAQSPEDRLVGNWTVDTEGTKIPDIPIPDLVKPFREQMRNVHVKLLSDRTFVLASPTVVEGKWSYKAGEVEFVPAKQPDKSVLRGFDAAASMFTGKTVRAKLNSEQTTLTVTQDTPIGPVVLRLRKSG